MTTTRTSKRIHALRTALQVPTAFVADDADKTEARLIEWQQMLSTLFPETAQHLRRNDLSPYATILTWSPPGDTPDMQYPDDAAPVLLTAHYDVVPVDADAAWRHGPWDGALDDGFIWGRGAIDDKTSHIALLLAVEELLEAGYQPARELVFAFGGDEERGGERGAATIAQKFAAEGRRFAAVLDEGAVVVEGMLPAISGPIALIGCGEKGHVDLTVSLASPGGHAAHPPRNDPFVRFSRAVGRLLSARRPIRRGTTLTAFVRALGSNLRGIGAVVLRWYPLTAPIVDRVLSKTAETDAMQRTTFAVTQISGSPAHNVLPESIRANLNVRIAPGETVDDVLRHARRTVGCDRDSSLSVELGPNNDHNDPPRESAPTGRWFSDIQRSITAVWGEIPVLPYVVTSTTDSRHYAGVADTIYRFVPIQLNRDDLGGVHGTNERISTENIDRAVEFYKTLLQRFGAK